MISIKLGRIRLGINRNIKKKDYVDKSEFKYDRKTDLVPKSKNRLICIMLSESKGCRILLRPLNSSKKDASNSFKYDKGLYIIENEGIHISPNGARVSVYIEGISTPIKASIIEKTTEDVEYIDLYGKKCKSLITRIKGLAFDAKILYTFANEEFARIFTKPQKQETNWMLIIFILIAMGASIASCIIGYVRV